VVSFEREHRLGVDWAPTAGGPAGRWWFGVLGPLHASCDGELVRLGGERQWTLLALLSAHANELMTVDQLVERLFGVRRRDGAVNAARVAVGRLRRVLMDSDREDEVLQSRPGGSDLLVEPGQLDAAAFERLSGEGRGLLAAGQPAGRREGCERRWACGAGRRSRTCATWIVGRRRPDDSRSCDWWR
jgi:hypothetical protein